MTSNKEQSIFGDTGPSREIPLFDDMTVLNFENCSPTPEKTIFSFEKKTSTARFGALTGPSSDESA